MKLPNCAFCGGPLRGIARILLDWTFPGWTPRVGWCGAAVSGAACMTPDPLASRLANPADASGREVVEQLLHEIAARGPGRVVGAPEQEPGTSLAR